MTELPELRAVVLATAARRAHGASHPTPARERSHRRALRTGMFAIGAVLVTASALAASGVWRPQLGDDHRGRPTISSSPVPAQQLAAFGVLRRAATAADHGPQVRYALRYLDGQAFGGVRTDAVRLLSAAGNGHVLIPATRASSKRDALCLFAIDPADGGGLSCWTTAEILAHKATQLSLEAPQMSPRERQAQIRAVRKAAKAAHGRAFTVPGMQPPMGDHTTISGLVPDGVAAVQISHGTAAQQATVANNFFTATIRQAPASVPIGPLTVTWLDSADRKLTR